MSSRFHVFCCARPNDLDRLRTDLASSPEINSGKVGLSVLWDQPSASRAYSQALATATAEILIFAHCDVYFPEGWFKRLEWEVERLSHMDREWAVAGISSITPSGQLVGRMFDTSLAPFFADTAGVYGEPLKTPVPIVSTDELALVVRRRSGASFDPLLPGFHLYGTDVILEAEQQGKRSYGLDMPLIHNAKAQLRLGSDYRQAYGYMVQKWRHRLPVRTTCVALTTSPFTLTIARSRLRYKAIFKSATYSEHRLSNPSAKALELNLEHLLAPPTEAEVGVKWT